jgi:hypothetical protein
VYDGGVVRTDHHGAGERSGSTQQYDLEVHHASELVAGKAHHRPSTSHSRHIVLIAEQQAASKNEAWSEQRIASYLMAYRRDFSKKTEAPAGLPADLLFFWGKKNKGGEFLLNKKPVRLSSPFCPRLRSRTALLHRQASTRWNEGGI